MLSHTGRTFTPQDWQFNVGDEIIAKLNTGATPRWRIEKIDTDKCGTPKNPYLLLRPCAGRGDDLLLFGWRFADGFRLYQKAF